MPGGLLMCRTSLMTLSSSVISSLITLSRDLVTAIIATYMGSEM